MRGAVVQVQRPQGAAGEKVGRAQLAGIFALLHYTTPPVSKKKKKKKKERKHKAGCRVRRLVAGATVGGYRRATSL
jgi:hypothetical protein